MFRVFQFSLLTSHFRLMARLLSDLLSDARLAGNAFLLWLAYPLGTSSQWPVLYTPRRANGLAGNVEPARSQTAGIAGSTRGCDG